MKRYDLENTKQILFPELPKEQFGFILACNFIDKFPLPIIEAYLSEIFNLLRPGGVMLFTFNDCDIPHNIQLVERGYRPYTPGKEVRKLIKKLGYEILNHHSESYGIAWFEIKKPGEIRSSRGGQPLGKICHYPIPVEKKKPTYLNARKQVVQLPWFLEPKREWVNRGQFQEEHDYNSGDMVTFKGFFYRALENVKNGSPFNIDQWVECGPNGEINGR
jgi:SAM-dependent methyltransferase